MPVSTINQGVLGNQQKPGYIKDWSKGQARAHPSFPYRMKWTRRDSSQLLRVLFIVRVMLNGKCHIGHLRFPGEALASVEAAYPLRTHRLARCCCFRLKPSNHGWIVHLAQRMQGCIDAPETRCKVVAVGPLPAGGLSTTCDVTLESLVLINC
jgi:hypothetical protein